MQSSRYLSATSFIELNGQDQISGKSICDSGRAIGRSVKESEGTGARPLPCRLFEGVLHVTHPEIAVLVSSYERPKHLLRVLHSIACQQHVQGKFEVVVTDDGSKDETQKLVKEFADSVSFPVGFTTHEHRGFELARCRNEGVRASKAPYLLFLDGDCLIPPDHLDIHLKHRRPGVVYGGHCVWLDNEASEKVDVAMIRSGEFSGLASSSEIRRLARADRKARLQSLLRHPTKPKLFGGNIGISRSDYEAVNGFDEQYVGWGCEDDDLRLRLRQAGMRIRSILRWTRTYHLRHPPGVTKPAAWREGANTEYLLRTERPARCVRGLNDLSVQAESRAA